MKINKLLTRIVFGLMLGFAAIVAHAQSLKVTLNGAQEVPSISTQATGNGNIMIMDDGAISGEITTKNIDGTMAHIHEAAKGQNGPVIVKLVKSGKDAWSIPSGTKLTDEQMKSLKSGHLYVNVHSEAHKSGEIRGQLQP